MSIDWSKAPEEATHGRQTFSGPEFYKHVDGVFCFLTASGKWEPAVSSPRVCVARPVEPAPEWDGKGLPPVGAVCEIDPNLAHCDYYARHVGKPVHVVAHGTASTSDSATAIYWVMGDDGFKEYHHLVAGNFRSILTPEQIAEDARQKAVNLMMVDAGVDDKEWSRTFCADLYDAGYRKTCEVCAAKWGGAQ